jgi:UDP-3-O-[3-hydroxymyristoyl] glucosamine N-acyltransferase
MSGELWLVGCGRVFESIAASWESLEPGTRVVPVRLGSTNDIAGPWETRLADAPAAARFFVAVDQSALNFARFDAWARLRMAGRRLATLVHPSATVDPTAHLGENCWIGARAVIEPNVKLAADVFVGATALVGLNASVGAHGWMGAGAAVGADATIGTHVVIGADVRVGAGVAVGRHSSIDVPGFYGSALAERTYIDPLFEVPVRIHSGRAPGGH